MLTGILVRFESDKLVMAATDSYRLSVKETPLSTPGPDLEAIIPARALGELARIAAGAETLQLGVNENHVIFGSGRRLADDATDRRAVPERAGSCSRRRSRRSSTCRARSCSTSSVAPA